MTKFHLVSDVMALSLECVIWRGRRTRICVCNHWDCGGRVGGGCSRDCRCRSSAATMASSARSSLQQLPSTFASSPALISQRPWWFWREQNERLKSRQKLQIEKLSVVFHLSPDEEYLLKRHFWFLVAKKVLLWTQCAAGKHLLLRAMIARNFDCRSLVSESL